MALTISLRPDSPNTLATDVVVVAATTSKEGPVLLAHPSFSGVADQLKALGFTGRADELLRLPALAGAAGSIAVIGVGDAVTVDTLRAAAGSAVRQLAGNATVAFALPLTSAEEVTAVAEGASLAAYSFTRFRSKTLADQKAPVGEVTIATEVELPKEALERIGILSDTIATVKNMVNTPGAELSPQALADATIAAVEGLPITVEVWDEVRIKKEGLGGIMGIGQGSSRQPRLIKVSYSPAGATKHLAYVGKGITFDTGGYSIKPSDAMLTMQKDMGGAATVLGATIALARLGAPLKVTAWLAVAENMISGDAIRVNDVLTMRGGTTVEVLNTDAEGRLVMADALVLASEEFPDAIIDVATLTGAIIVSLGRRTAGVIGDDEVVDGILAAAKTTGEPHWPLPLPAELKEMLKSKVADMANLNPSVRDGGSLVAGLFLREFVGQKADGSGRIPWAHLDTAGTVGNAGAPYSFFGEGATGSSVRTLVVAAEAFAK